MREVQIVAYCDLCEAGQIQGQTFTITLGGVEREIELCKLHENQLGLDQLAKTLNEHGHPPFKESSRSPQTRGPQKRKRDGGERLYACAFCPADYTSTTGLNLHELNFHKMPGTLTELLGGQCPLCDRVTPMLHAHAQKDHGVTLGAAFRTALANSGARSPLRKILLQVEGATS